jgi:hypothetical protein
MRDHNTNAKLDALYLETEHEWIQTRVADYIEDFGSRDGTLEGIEDPDQRAECARTIAREKRDHDRRLRERAKRVAIERAADKAAHNAWKAEQRRREAEDAGDERVTISPQQVFKRFNRKATTG